MHETERKHALLSPSAAHRWLRCPAAVRLEELMPEESSSYAYEGSCAHALAASKLQKLLSGAVEDDTARELTELWPQYGNDEMEEHVRGYVDYVRTLHRQMTAGSGWCGVGIEQRVTVTPELFGTADCLLRNDDTVHVVDLKYGAGVRVDAWNNPQMMLYALGALTEADSDNTWVKMTIYQPRLDNVSEWGLSAGALRKWWNDTAAPAAARALVGIENGEPGKWCMFCRAKTRCRARLDKAREALASSPDPRLLGDHELGATLAAATEVKSWAAAVEKEALERATARPGSVWGWKLAPGRATRVVSDPAALAAALRAEGADFDSVYRLATITDLERAFGKKRFAAVAAPYITKREGSPRLVPTGEGTDRPGSPFADLDISDL